MTFPMKKRINIELFINERAALYIYKSASKNKGQREEDKIMSSNEQQ